MIQFKIIRFILFFQAGFKILLVVISRILSVVARLICEKKTALRNQNKINSSSKAKFNAELFKQCYLVLVPSMSL